MDGTLIRRSYGSTADVSVFPSFDPVVVAVDPDKFYWILQLASVETPAGGQILVGKDGTSTTAIASGNVTDTSQASPISGTTLSGLTYGTNYEIAWTHNNLPVHVVSIEFTAGKLRPQEDVTAGAWTATSGTLASVLDELSYVDADYITTTSASTSEIKLQGALDPSSSTDHVINFRAKNDGSLGLQVKLYQGTTLISSYTPTLTSSYQNFSWTLSGAEADAITDYADLRVRFVAV